MKERTWSPNCVEGYRWWTGRFENDELLPPHVGEGFRPGVRLEAVCPTGKDPPCAKPCAGFGHGCGLYAVKKRSQLHVSYGTRDAPAIIARVALWGRVDEHELGYRGQYAYPLRIVEIRTPKPLADKKKILEYGIAMGELWSVPYWPES